MSNLLKLLQPKNYISKIKLFCREKEIEKITLEKFAQVDRKNYIRKQIEIKGL